MQPAALRATPPDVVVTTLPRGGCGVRRAGRPRPRRMPQNHAITTTRCVHFATKPQNRQICCKRPDTPYHSTPRRRLAGVNTVRRPAGGTAGYPCSDQSDVPRLASRSDCGVRGSPPADICLPAAPRSAGVREGITLFLQRAEQGCSTTHRTRDLPGRDSFVVPPRCRDGFVVRRSAARMMDGEAAFGRRSSSSVVLLSHRSAHTRRGPSMRPSWVFRRRLSVFRNALRAIFAGCAANSQPSLLRTAGDATHSVCRKGKGGPFGGEFV